MRDIPHDRVMTAKGLVGEIAAACDAAIPDGGGVGHGLEVLRRAGLLTPSAVDPTRGLALLLRDVASANLPLARLLEGHANAWRLIRVHGSKAQRAAADEAFHAGVLHGVWGADGTVPVGWDGERLSGGKRWASGLGLVAGAIVAARSAEGQQLVLCAATNPDRHLPEQWNMAGMQASRSGGFDCGGLDGEPLGRPDAYTREPWFVGGTWRIAAVTLGATLGLLDRAAGVLNGRGHLEAEAQVRRLTAVAIRALSVWPAIERAGAFAEGSSALREPERAAVRSAAARLISEEVGQGAIAAVERSLGLRMFEVQDPVGRAARDLACYMRQAARDAFELRVGQALFAGDISLAQWLDD
jgi:hypothetical protein